jgi:hypothetical protein
VLHAIECSTIRGDIASSGVVHPCEVILFQVHDFEPVISAACTIESGEQQMLQAVSGKCVQELACTLTPGF